MPNQTTNLAETYARIMESATEQFSIEGFHGTDVQVVADRANVGKGTVYRHFGNKEKLFLATARNCMEGLGKFVEKRVGEPDAFQAFVKENGIAATLKEIAISCAEYYQEHPATIEIMLQERAVFRDRVYPSHLMFRAKHREAFTQLLTDSMKQGFLREVDVDLAHAAYGDLIWGSCINGRLEASTTGKDVDLIERTSVAMDLFLRGFALERN